MRSGSKRLAALAGALVAGALAAPAGGQQGWWNYHWSCRRAVTISDVPRAGLPGDEIGVVTMPTGGLIRRDAADVRVTSTTGKLLPHRVLMVGPGDRIRIAFALHARTTKYFVYFGNPKAEKPKDELQIRRGVLLESWGYRGGGISDLRRVQLAFKSAGGLIGRDFVGQVFLGHNPFGPQNRLCNRFTGYLVCRTAGEYLFSTSSRDASFLLIDGKLVVANGGLHPPQRRAAKRGRIRLSKGLHELKVYHVNTRGDPVMVAAWQVPAAGRPWKIPSRAFAQIRRAKPGLIERYGKTLHADFIPDHAGETFMANRYFQRYVFEALFKGRLPGKAQCRWTFGDGLSATGRRCEHVYLRNGPFKVTLTVKAPGRSLERTNTIYISRPWHRVTSSRLDPLADHARIVAAYDFKNADSRDIGLAIALLNRAGQGKAVLRAGDALVKREAAPANVLREALPVYADRLAAGDPARAVAALLKGTEMTKAPAARCVLTVKAGRIALASGEADKALAIFGEAIKKYSALTTGRSIRDARVGIGDVWRLRGKYAQALEAYKSAGAARRSSYEKQAVRKGDLARHVEDYIRQGMFHDARDFLDRWEWEFPTDKLDGFSTLLRVRLAMGEKDYAAAAEQAEQLVRVNFRSNYAAELLMFAAKAYKANRKADLTRATLRRIVKSYPESPLAADAKKQLGLK